MHVYRGQNYEENDQKDDENRFVLYSRGRLQIQTRIRLIGSPLYLEFMKAGVKAHSDTILCTFLLFSADMIYITVVNTIVLQAADWHGG